MTLRPLIITAVLLAAGSVMTPASAQQIQGFTPAPSQGFGTAPGAPGAARNNPFDTPPGTLRQQKSDPPCFKEFSALRTETEKRGQAIQAAGKKKVGPDVACK